MDEAALRARELRRHERGLELQWLGGCVVAVLTALAVAAVLAGAVALFASALGDRDREVDDPGRRDAYGLRGAAVRVTPTTGLADGDRVVVASNALPPRRVVEVVPCLLHDDGAVDRCDRARGARHAVPADGRFAVELVVPRVLRLGADVVDCAAPDVACAVLAADVDDPGTSGGARIRFRDDVAPTVPEAVPDPPLDPAAATLEPPSPVTAGDRVTVVATGFDPGEPVRIGACPSTPRDIGELACAPVDGDDPLVDPVATVPAEGPYADITGTVRTEVHLTTVDCSGARGCVLVVTAAVDPRRLAVVPVRVVP